MSSLKLDINILIILKCTFSLYLINCIDAAFESNICLVDICAEMADEHNILDSSLGYFMLLFSECDRFLFQKIYNLSLQDTVFFQTTLIY